MPADYVVPFSACRRIVPVPVKLPLSLAGHILSRIYNCTKAGNQRAKRGESRESEGAVAPEGENFMDIRTRPLGASINHFFINQKMQLTA